MSGIGNKRSAGEPGPSAPPEKKAGVEDSGTTVETIKLGGVSSTVCLPCTLTQPLAFFHLETKIFFCLFYEPSHLWLVCIVP